MGQATIAQMHVGSGNGESLHDGQACEWPTAGRVGPSASASVGTVRKVTGSLAPCSRQRARRRVPRYSGSVRLSTRSSAVAVRDAPLHVLSVWLQEPQPEGRDSRVLSIDLAASQQHFQINALVTVSFTGVGVVT